MFKEYYKFRSSYHSLRQLIPASVLCYLLAFVGCSKKQNFVSIEFKAWHKADQLFRQDSLWRGGDAAYSVDLGEGKILWLFGDSFVGGGPDMTRSNRKMVRNTIGIQNGYDPTQASIKFYYGKQNEQLESFFPNKSDEWLWPGPGQKIGNSVLLTFTRLIQMEQGMFGFRVVGSEACYVLNSLQPPTEWQMTKIPLPQTPEGVKFGTGTFLKHKDFLYAYVVIEPGIHDVYLARWHKNDVVEMNLMKPSWWDGNNWILSPNDAIVIVKALQTEFSVTRSFNGKFWMVSVEGIGATDVYLRTAINPEGPWSNPQIIYHPPESNRNNILVYSVKAYPYHQIQDFVFTYCTNHKSFWEMASDINLYFPRFVRLLKHFQK